MRSVCYICLFLSLSIQAQDAGGLDPTFNSLDQGQRKGDGRNGATWDLEVLTDDSYIAVGDNEVSKYLEDGQLDPAFVPAAINTTGRVHCVAVQSDGRILVGGSFTTISGVARGRIARLMPNGALDPSFASGAGFNSSVYAIVPLADGSILVSGSFSQLNGTSQGRIARLTNSGTLDATFVIGTGFATGTVYAMALQPDGKVLVGQSTTSFNGAACGRLLRLNANGSLDTSFNELGTGPNDLVRCIALRPDGRMVIGGDFTTYNGAANNRVASVLANGMLDGGFATGTGFDDRVTSLLTKPNGDVLVGGSFTMYNGVYRAFHARLRDTGSLVTEYEGHCGYGVHVYTMAEQTGGRTLTAGYYSDSGGGGINVYCRVERFYDNGTLDHDFDKGTGLNSGLVWKIVAQPDGKMIITGFFNKYNGQRAVGLVRIDQDGEYDNTFQTGFGAHQGCPVCLDVACVAVQPDGKIVLGGIFPFYNGVPAAGLIRVNSDGSVDPTFSVSGIFSSGTMDLKSIAVQSDGKILISGYFDTIYGIARNKIARLTATGALDPTFDPGTGLDFPAEVIKVIPDGRILLGGIFNTYNGTPSSKIARILPNGSIDNSFLVGTGFLGTVADIELYAWGDYAVGGNFSDYNGTAVSHLVRLNNVGELQGPVSGDVPAFPVRAISIAGTSFVYIVGGFGSESHVSRMSSTGATRDNTFVTAVVVARDMDISWSTGRPVVVGSLFDYLGNNRNRVARLLSEPIEPQALNPRVFLGGPYTGGNSMSDAMRAQGLIPLQEPYTALGYRHVHGGGEITTNAVLSVTGNNAIVDWVVIELRSRTNPATRVATQSALVQRDGDVVSTDGVSPVIFNVPSGDYKVAVQHRNHLGVMGSFNVGLYGSPSNVNFTNPLFAAYGSNAQNNVNGTMVLWPGDGSGNGTVRYTGADNDRDQVLQAIGGSVPTNVLSNVYDARDVNLDGAIMYVGANNDRDLILQTIGGTVPTATRTQQLP